MPTAIELFANPPSSPATVSSGGTTAVTAGTSQTWTMAGGYASYPAASNAASPPTQFHIYDVANPSEIMLVTNVSGSTWTVTRGVDNTTPTTHVAGFTIAQVVSAAVLANLTQNTTTMPVFQADTTAFTCSGTSFVQMSKAWSIPANDGAVGSVYRLTVFGTGTWAAAAPSLNFTLAAFGTTLATVRLGATTMALNTTFSWVIVYYVIIKTTGSSGTFAAAAHGSISISTAATNLAASFGTSAQASAGFCAEGTASCNTTAGTTIELQAEWQTNAGTIASAGSMMERIGT
jgi:hypothetical protein